MEVAKYCTYTGAYGPYNERKLLIVRDCRGTPSAPTLTPGLLRVTRS